MGVWGAVVGGVAGGIYGGLTSYANAKEHALQYKKAAKQIRDAAQKYSGDAANNAIMESGRQKASEFGQMSTQAAASKGNLNNSNAMANALAGAKNVENNNLYQAGNTLGRSNAASNISGKYNAATTEAQNLMNQADVNQQVGAATNQAVMNTAGGLADLYKNISDENMKESINNESGLPASDIEDSMRQLETISYQYKDPNMNGCDGEKHDSGFTAQSAEKTKLFGDAVETNEQGIKQIDKWKLLEAVTAGIAQLQREIDDLNGGKSTSDERCKTAENVIESNPEQAAKQLPQGSPIQQEAVQATQNGPQAEVNNKVIDDYVNNYAPHFKYLKPNYETLKNMPNIPNFSFDNNEALMNLMNSDWWKEQNKRPRMFQNNGSLATVLIPGFDYNFDAIKADYPDAYLEGESPEELKQKAHDALIEDALDEYNKTGDISVLEDYIKEGGDAPTFKRDIEQLGSGQGARITIPDEAKLHLALRNKYPEFFDKEVPDIEGLRKFLLDKENVKEETVDPVTAKMNAGLSEDDPDYFGSDERIKKPIAKTGRRING